MNKKLILSNDVHFFFSQVTEAHANIDVRELQYLNDSLFLYKKKNNARQLQLLSLKVVCFTW